MTNKIIITIPAYNEEHTLGPVIKEIQQIMDFTSYNYQIQVINDGSKDRTIDVAKNAGAQVYSLSRNKGLAEAFKFEMEKCLENKADIIVHTDADGQYNPRHIPNMIKKVEEGYDLVLGSRFRGGLEYMPFVKKLGNRLFASLFSKVLKTKVTDTTTGFRAFTKDIAREIKLINTFTYTQEQLIKASFQKFKITEIPIDARKTRESRLFKNPLEYAIRAWVNLLRIYRDYKPLKFFGGIGILFFTAGFIIGFVLLLKFIRLGVVERIPTLILGALLMLMGIQIILFGFLADKLK
jgi:glycosyltransferase involved in cell wall biosynthesis